MVALFFAVADNVHFGFDIYSTIVELLPVNAIVEAFVSTTVPLTVGSQALRTV